MVASKLTGAHLRSLYACESTCADFCTKVPFGEQCPISAFMAREGEFMTGGELGFAGGGMVWISR